MATRKKTKKKNAPKKLVARKSAKSSAASGSRKVSAKAKVTRSKTKAHPARAKAKKSAKPRKRAARMAPPRDTARVFRSSILTHGESQSVETVDRETKGLGSNSGGQSGDLQGLSNVESADSESVGELLEEGNAYEAEIVKGVQDVPDADESEVHTHQGREEDDLAEDFREN